MKRKRIVLFLMPLVMLVAGNFIFVSCRNEPEVEPQYATLKEALQNIELISMIEADPDTAAVRKKREGTLDYKEQYSMFFEQDLDHTDEGGEAFQQRVCILFRGFDRPTILVTEGYLWDGFGDVADLGINLNANMVHVEHRNYGQSCNDDNGVWQYQTLAQGSADLHAVYQALKPVFKGKWMSSGTSKSGETSITYAYHYPQDMNLATAFGAPLAQSLNDERFGTYLFEEIGTEEDRALMKSAIRKALQNGEEGFYKTVCQRMENANKPKPPFAEYVFNVFDSFFQLFQYYTPADGREKYLQMLATYDEVLLDYVMQVLDGNRDPDTYPYFVECTREMGMSDNGYDYFADLLQGTSFSRDDVLPSLLNEQDQWVISAYDGSTFSDIVNRFYMTTTCPLLLFYSHDDPWSAGRPEQVGPNVKVVVNPIGKHSSVINNPVYCPEETRQEVMDFVSTYIY